ncbi:MAG TPA: glutamyl-tRNA reductase [Stellaceae bacterium]
MAPPLPLVVVGANHRSCPLDLRERLTPLDAETGPVLDALRAAGFAEAVLLATCDRVEVIAAGVAPDEAARIAASVLGTRAALPDAAILPLLYVEAGSAAVRHLFAVASALDSLVIGEPQILGQMKAAHRAAADAGMVGGALEAALGAAYGAAKRVRSETRIAERPVSIAAAALQLARDVHGPLDRCTALLLGPSEMGELMAEQLRRAGLGRLVVAGPAAGRAAAAARRLQCNDAPFDGLGDALAESDIVVSSVGGGRVLLAAPFVEKVLRRRRRRPIFLVDAAVPPDIEPAVNELDGAFLYDLGDLERVAMAGRATREAAAQEAWRIVEAEASSFERRLAERTGAPAVTALRRHFEAVRAQVLAEAPGADAEAATRRLVNRLLHDPSEVLRRLAAERDSSGGCAPPSLDAGELLRRLFRLERDEGGGGEGQE